MTSLTGFTDFDPVITQASIHRPRSLIRAAQAGQSGWRRRRDLPRLLRRERCPGRDDALSLLQFEEARLNGLRLLRAPGYNMRRHVLVMIAMLAELQAGGVSGPGTASPEHP